MKVTKAAMRLASPLKQCFYCQQPINADHNPDCVLIKKKITIKVVTQLVVSVPHHWTEDHIVFHYNHGSWCAGNLADIIDDNGCICDTTEITPITTEGKAFLEET